jgi:hypothetical protein
LDKAAGHFFGGLRDAGLLTDGRVAELEKLLGHEIIEK